MFEFVGHVENSYRDYQHLLKYQRYLIKEHDVRSVELAMDDDLIADEFEDIIDQQNGNE
jgi:Nuclear condensing complex subunits, C-term domain